MGLLCFFVLLEFSPARKVLLACRALVGALPRVWQQRSAGWLYTHTDAVVATGWGHTYGTAHAASRARLQGASVEDAAGRGQRQHTLGEGAVAHATLLQGHVLLAVVVVVASRRLQARRVIGGPFDHRRRRVLASLPSPGRLRGKSSRHDSACAL